MLHIHRAERADGLVEALGAVVAAPLDDVLAPEVVAVPTRGVERWVAQRLSTRLGAAPGGHDGVCANVTFPFPGRLVGEAVAAATGVDRDADPWLPTRSVWPLLEVVDECLGEPWLGSLAAHLGGAGADADPLKRQRRFASVRHVADLYDRYGVHRPAMLRAWAGGDDTDGAGSRLPPEVAWQAELWRRLHHRIGHPSPAERLEAACARLVADPAVAGLPARLSLFGLTRLPAGFLAVLRALAAGRDVHLFLLHPSPALWARVADGRAEGEPSAGGGAPGAWTPRRADDPTAGLARHPLLASWGQDAREMQLVLTAGDEPVADHHRPVDTTASALLGRIQADIRADRAPPGAPRPGEEDARPLLDRADRSLQVHACHGRARQVEVVRDAILHLLADDPTLEARDVIVMCPDIEAFAPLVQATFGAAAAAEGGDGDAAEEALPPDGRPPDLRVRLADRSLRQTNPILGVVARVLDLADARMTAAEVLDLAGREPVRRRFRFDDDDLGRIEEWVAATGVRWGLDGAHRAPFLLDGLDANTWRTGLDRVLLGVAMADEGHHLVGGALPLDDVASGDIDLAGRLAELVDRLHAAVTALSGPQPVAAWATAVAAAADALTATAPDEAWPRAELQRLLDEITAEAGAAAGAVDLTLTEIRALLGGRLQGRPTRANFRTGHLTVCTLVPMRSVPHRVVCLLGLDDGSFPRRTVVDGDDLVAADPRVGDRDPRSEDRQLLLDALLAATDRLVVAYSGRDERTNAERPPAVPVGELLDVVDRTVRTGERSADGREVPARRRIVVHHPLQPFDARNFTVGGLVDGRAWSFDAVALEGACALTGHRHQPEAFLPGRLPPAHSDPVEIDQLVRFLGHPVRGFLRQRLGVTLSDAAEDAPRSLPVELDGLARWGVGQRLLEGRLAGASLDVCLAAERARGTLPPGALATPVVESIGPTVEAVAAEAVAAGAGAGTVESVDVNVVLPDGRSLVGTVPGVVGDLLVSATFSKVGARQRLATWARFLALTAMRPGRPISAVTVGRRRDGGPKGSRITVARLAPLPGDAAARRSAAVAHLADLVDLYDRGLREPLPLYCDTSAAWAEAAADPARDPETAAARRWDSGFNRRGENADPDHLLVLGGAVPFAAVLAGPAAEEDATEVEGGDAAGDGPAPFARYATQLWGGLLAWEEVTDR